MFCCNAAQGASSPSPGMAITSALHTNNLRPALSTSSQATIARAALPIEGQIWLAQRYAVDYERLGTMKPSAMSTGSNTSS